MVGRADYMEAMVELSFDRGCEAISIEEIAAYVGGSRAGFEEHFGDKQACAVAVLQELVASNLREVGGAFEGESKWPDSLRAAGYAHARWILENPKKMRFGLFETLWAGELASALRDDVFGAYIAMVDAGREVAEDPGSIPTYTAESVVGSIIQVVVKNLVRPDKPGARDPFSLVQEMMYLAVRPYLGEEAARRELTIPPPSS
jgi:AcrR family transcriptional regulator